MPGSIWPWGYHWWRLARCWLLAACTAASGSLMPGQRPNRHQECKPRFGLAVVIGAVVGTPGGEYLLALHELVTGKAATAVQATDVVVFVVIEFALVIVPFAFLVARPEGVKAAVERFKAWLVKHALQVVGAVALVAGGYIVISGVLRLS